MMSKKLSWIILAGIAIGLIVYIVNRPIEKNENIVNNNQIETITKEQIIDSIPKVTKRYKVGVLFPMLAAPFWINESYGVLNQAKKIGVDIIWYSADGYTNVDKQNSQIEDLITQKVDAILIAPTSLTGNTPAIEKAINKGIKVLIHVTSSSAKDVSGKILANDIEIGKKQAEYIVKKLKGRGEVIMLVGPSGADWSMNRANGFKDYIRNYAKDITIVAERSSEPERVASQKLIEELLIKFKDIDAIYTAADGMAVGVTEVLSRTKTNKHIILTTASFSKESVPYIRTGQISLNVDESPVLQGRTAMNAVIYSLEGYNIPNTIYVPIPGIDKENLNDINLINRWAPDEFSPSN